jgi:glyoxylase-like metal-dependent hydrolase (beta-lactamase superfamily II)
MKVWLAVRAAATALIFASCASAQDKKTQVLWLGQSAFRIVSPEGKVIVIDPWLTKGPLVPARYKDLSALGKIDVLLVTHAHGDHLGDAPALAKMHHIPLWGPGGMNQALATLSVLPPAQLPRPIGRPRRGRQPYPCPMMQHNSEVRRRATITQARRSGGDAQIAAPA